MLTTQQSSNHEKTHMNSKIVLGKPPISSGSIYMEVPIQAFGNDRPTLNLVGRQSGGGVTVGTTVLPIGAIIGIAIVGSAILFGVLMMAIMHYLRSRYQQKNRTRDLDLSDDNEEDILDALRSTRPPERGLVTKTTHKPSNLGTETLPKDWTNHHFHGPQLYKSRLMPPAYAFEITGLRDSWPLVGWVESPSTLPLSANKQPVINSGNTDRRTPYSALPLSVDNEPSWPQPAFSRSCLYTRGNDGRPIQWSGHSAKSSITSLKRPSSTRKSVSDNQLTSILRSTSQRLREAQRRPLSRSLSVLSQVSGAPPTIQPPTPPRDQRGESREALIETDDFSLIDSVRSSVLNSTSQTPSPNKIVVHTADKIKGIEKEASPTTSEVSESDSLCPSKTPDLFIPAALTSPSKRGARTDQRYEMRISSTGGPSATVHQDDRHSLLARRGTGVIYNIHLSNQIGSTSDPFVSADARTKLASKPKSVKGPRPLIKRQVVVEQDSNCKGREAVTPPFRVVSGNQKSPPKSKPASVEPSGGMQENPFQWSPQCSPSLILSPGQKPIGIKPKGHKRRRTVRLSHLTRPASVAVVLEEPENGSTPPCMDGSDRTQTSCVLSPEEPISTSMYPNHSKISGARPPSIPIFQPFLAVPSTGASKDSKISSDGSYSTTMPFYDYYSSGDAFRSDRPSIPRTSQSPTPSTKKSRRRGCNFSIDITRAKEIALLEATASGLQFDRPLSPPKYTPTQFSNFGISNDASAVPTFTSHLYGLTSPPPPAVNDSVTASVCLLRRMNSEVSTYSTGSFLSDHSNGSPTIPELRGGGLSHTKRGSEGTMNYLSIGVKTPSPAAKRGRMWVSGIAGKSRDYRQSLVLNDGLEHFEGLGLRMPILEDSPPKLPPIEPLTRVSGQEDWPPTPPDWPFTLPKGQSLPRRAKPPTAQLRPMSSTPMSQENCHSCNKPLSPLGLNPRDNTLASRYHDHCFKCNVCTEPLGTAFAIDKKPYCKQHYYEKVSGICNTDGSANLQIGQGDHSSDRWSEVMVTPLKKSVRHESQLEMPSPHDGSPKSMIKWRGSLGLYDEMGFLKNSPDRGHYAGSFGLGPVEDVIMGT
jgi:hypothetical protein